MSLALRSAALLARSSSRPVSKFLIMRTSASAAAGSQPPVAVPFGTHDHSTHFKLERLFAAGMLPLVPAAYFIHGTTMDWALAIAITLHTHWGVAAVVEDYARPIVVGEGTAKALRITPYILTILLFLGLAHFNTHDVGITKAFSMLFAL